jgi:hypothetical protein
VGVGLVQHARAFETQACDEGGEVKGNVPLLTWPLLPPDAPLITWSGSSTTTLAQRRARASAAEGR